MATKTVDDAPSASVNPNAFAPFGSGGVGGGDPLGSGGGDVGSVPPDFRAAVLAAMQRQLGPKFTVLPPNQVDDLIQGLWASSSIQQEWANYTSTNDTLGQLTTFIEQDMADPTRTTDAQLASQFTQMKMAAGVPLSTSQQDYLNTTGAPVPLPFAATGVSGYDYGTPMPPGGWVGDGNSYGWTTHEGIDYGTTAGEAIRAPFAGTVEVQSGLVGYGNRVILKLDNGYELAFGHVAGGAVPNGMRVQPGDQIAIAGQNVGDSQGSVTLVEWMDPQGNHLNPHSIMDPILAPGGTTYSKLIGAGIDASSAGQPISSTDAQRRLYGIYDQTMETVYSPVKSAWQQYFGREPTTAQLQDVVNHGSDLQSWTDYIRSLPSHVPGLSAGAYYDHRTLADKYSQAVFGHNAADSVVQDMYNQGYHTEGEIKSYFDHAGAGPGRGIDPGTYATFLKLHQPHAAGLYNSPPDHRDIVATIKQAGIDVVPPLVQKAADQMPSPDQQQEGQG